MRRRIEDGMEWGPLGPIYSVREDRAGDGGRGTGPTELPSTPELGDGDTKLSNNNKKGGWCCCCWLRFMTLTVVSTSTLGAPAETARERAVSRCSRPIHIPGVCHSSTLASTSLAPTPPLFFFFFFKKEISIFMHLLVEGWGNGTHLVSNQMLTQTPPDVDTRPYSQLEGPATFLYTHVGFGPTSTR